jgi:chemotaxis protein MotD
VTSDAPPADILKIAAKAGAPERGPVTVAVKDTAPAPLPAVTDKTARAVSDIAASLAQAQTGKSEGDDTGDPSQQQDQTPERHDAPQADIALSAPKSAPAPQQQVSIPTEPVQAAPAPAAASVQASAAASAAPQPQAQAEVPLANLGAAIAARAMGGAKTFEIRLDPAELGRVDVQLNVGHDGKADATITVHRPETLALLLRDSQNLERTLRDSGLDVSNSSLNFSLKGEGRQGDGGGASGALRRNLPDSVLARSEAANASIASLNIGSPNGRLDIRV